jgi:protein-L-isoaspartate(D-aspartate) O-methyltransferase
MRAAAVMGMLAIGTLCVLMLTAGCGGDGSGGDGEPLPAVDQAALRREMVDRIRARGVTDEAVLAALGAVERHRFVPEGSQYAAYELKSLPIGSGQNITDPYLVAVMTALLELRGGERVLEIGTGSGYHAAVLSRIVREVKTIEILEPLAKEARSRLRELGIDNVEVRCGNGYLGWPEYAPFDAIILTAAPPEPPQALIDQLANGGRMLLPVGEWPANQDLTLIRKDVDGAVSSETVKPVRFGPMIGKDEK